MNSPKVSPASDATDTNTQPTLVRGLSLLDSVLLLVSGIIGSAFGVRLFSNLNEVFKK